MVAFTGFSNILTAYHNIKMRHLTILVKIFSLIWRGN